jgi:hypothetical protein
MELCFRDSYLTETLELLGWDVVRHDCPMAAAGVTYVATRR